MKVTINGNSVEIPDDSAVSIINGNITVNGNKFNCEFDKELKIEVTGGLLYLKTDRGDVTVNGDVTGNVEAGGSVQVSGNVNYRVDAGGSVTCRDVNGNVDAGGSVKCGKVSGNLNAGGSVMTGR